VLAGPARLLTAHLEAGTAGLCTLALSSGGRLMTTGAAGEAATLTFPPNTILPAGVSVTAAGGTLADAGVSYAYP
jgi:hypothetical protein